MIQIHINHDDQHLPTHHKKKKNNDHLYAQSPCFPVLIAKINKEGGVPGDIIESPADRWMCCTDESIVVRIPMGPFKPGTLIRKRRQRLYYTGTCSGRGLVWILWGFLVFSRCNVLDVSLRNCGLSSKGLKGVLQICAFFYVTYYYK